MSNKSSERKTFGGYYNSHNNRRKKRDLVVSNCSNTNGSSSTAYNKYYNKANRDDPGALILKLLHSGRNIETASVVPQSNSYIRPQSRTKNCESVEPNFKMQSEEPINVNSENPNATSVNLFATPPPNRKGRYSVVSSYGTNNPKFVNYSNSGGNKSLQSSSSNPTNFALPMYMRSPNPESIPMPCGFPIG
ncbi:hypothetical protein [Cryptosporidium parvum Iowa II]|uniref:Uncharacterized protein n=2 Tax=Cryptosporidium parvum TaxID=5807 RepID=Q5CSJ2_CRYPI|nr:hypothetical protein [Cryptosporidium parvum Iowa II]EAK88372.1 hypothetical protein cgd1_2460 [Cryptosporidium parvum Iowa II]QOY43380.1 Uncharacterized protein CPATCC_0036870 [Cryptosporidium parvum]WKS76148.1 hypothetical protein CPCDC_1g2460 [Cryptosporidium sp. 43IA8]WRK30640.1 Uncharacterized protein cpbgf_1002460 [Cryptosporidium parvum]|eukprot:QOY43380.1 hypothetical protein CPATCC_000162 [Cryptosporidium parvum]